MLDFQRDVIDASHRQPVLVDFHASWCPPCKMLGPVLAAAIVQAPGPIKLVKIDSDEHADLAATAGVSGIPDVRLYVHGQQVGGFTGFQPLPAVKRFIADHLARATQPADA
jgi:putative thioredoxin